MNIINSEENNENKNSNYFNEENPFHKFDNYCCPYCNNLPEILSFTEGNDTIKFKCKNHGENYLNIKDYLENIKNI